MRGLLAVSPLHAWPDDRTNPSRIRPSKGVRLENAGTSLVNAVSVADIGSLESLETRHGKTTHPTSRHHR